MADTLTREQRCDLLAAAERDEIVPLAERLVSAGETPEPTVIRPPEVGHGRPPGARASRRGPASTSARCWSPSAPSRSRECPAGACAPGDDRVAALAAALLDAVAAAELPAPSEIDALCARIADRRAQQDAAEWAEIESTTVSFEELT